MKILRWRASSHWSTLIDCGAALEIHHRIWTSNNVVAIRHHWNNRHSSAMDHTPVEVILSVIWRSPIHSVFHWREREIYRWYWQSTPQTKFYWDWKSFLVERLQCECRFVPLVREAGWARQQTLPNDGHIKGLVPFRDESLSDRHREDDRTFYPTMREACVFNNGIPITNGSLQMIKEKRFFKRNEYGKCPVSVSIGTLMPSFANLEGIVQVRQRMMCNQSTVSEPSRWSLFR